MDKLAEVNGSINDFVWVKVGLWLLIGTGVILTIATRFFQFGHFKHWWKNTIGSVFRSKVHNKSDKKSISQFQALCTALAATIGTGNIAGVSTAIVLGGPGAVFWMWIAAILGMMTNYSENVLGIYYRRRNEKGEWCGGAMYYLRDGLKDTVFGKNKNSKTVKVISAVLATLFSVFALLAAFGIGNMGQVNKITLNIKSAFFPNFDAKVFGNIPLVSFIIGAVLMVFTALIVIGGLQRIAAVAEKIVPFMAVLYILGSLVIVGVNYKSIGLIFASIFKFAFGVKAVAGGAAGIGIRKIITMGCKRGVFSNEAGLGSSVMVHSSSDTPEPVVQGMWGIFEVFFDTIIVCTMTALVVLSSGFIDISTGLVVGEVDDATLVAKAFGNVFGKPGECFVAIAVLLFAFTTVLGWSQYGAKAVEYLFGSKSVKWFNVIFVLMIMSGALMTSSLAWDISDTFNGLMMMPNLIGVLSLSGIVLKVTRNYTERKIKGKKDVKPILSAFPDIQAEQEKKVTEEE